jgi:hypothetical protein
VSEQREKENLEKVEINISTKVLVAGSGPVAHMAALELAKIGHQVLLCSGGTSPAGNTHLWGSSADNGPYQPSRLTRTISGDVNGKWRRQLNQGDWGCYSLYRALSCGKF